MKTFACLLALLFLGSLSLHAQSISVDHEWDQGFDFNTLSSYMWLPEPDGNSDGLGSRHMLFAPRIRSTADIDLGFKNYEKIVEGGMPNFMIGYHIVVEDEMNMAVINQYYGYAPNMDRWGRAKGTAGYASTYVDRYRQGTLILDIVDPIGGKLVWRGSASAVVDEVASLEERTATLQEAVTRILSSFPGRAA